MPKLKPPASESEIKHAGKISPPDMGCLEIGADASSNHEGDCSFENSATSELTQTLFRKATDTFDQQVKSKLLNSENFISLNDLESFGSNYISEIKMIASNHIIDLLKDCNENELIQKKSKSTKKKE